MNKTTILIAVAIVAAAAYYYYDKQKNAGALGDTSSPSTGGGTGGGGSNGGGTIPTPPPTPAPVLKRGSSGALVRDLQTQINAHIRGITGSGMIRQGTPPALLSVDGSFGAATENAMMYLYDKREAKEADFNFTQQIGAGFLPFPLNWQASFLKPDLRPNTIG